MKSPLQNPKQSLIAAPDAVCVAHVRLWVPLKSWGRTPAVKSPLVFRPRRCLIPFFSCLHLPAWSARKIQRPDLLQLIPTSSSSRPSVVPAHGRGQPESSSRRGPAPVAYNAYTCGYEGWSNNHRRMEFLVLSFAMSVSSRTTPRRGRRSPPSRTVRKGSYPDSRLSSPGFAAISRLAVTADPERAFHHRFRFPPSISRKPFRPTIHLLILYAATPRPCPLFPPLTGKRCRTARCRRPRLPRYSLTILLARPTGRCPAWILRLARDAQSTDLQPH
jgi:hypothetical protein